MTHSFSGTQKEWEMCINQPQNRKTKQQFEIAFTCLDGVSSVANFIIAFEESHFLISSVFCCVSKGHVFDVY